MTDTVAAKLTALDADTAKQIARQDAIRRVLTALPPDLPAPTVSNESDTAFFGMPGAWLSWRARYPHETGPTGAEILAALEIAGFEPLPVTVCKWDDYRATPEPGDQESIPETKGRYTLKDATIVAPLWIEPNPWTGTEASAYYRKDGVIYKVSVPGPSTCHVTARRREYHGGWAYESGTARLDYPDAWHSVEHDGAPILGVSHLSRAYRDTEQGLSAALYFELLAHEQTELPLTPSQILAVL